MVHLLEQVDSVCGQVKTKVLKERKARRLFRIREFLEIVEGEKGGLNSDGTTQRWKVFLT